MFGYMPDNFLLVVCGKDILYGLSSFHKSVSFLYSSQDETVQWLVEVSIGKNIKETFQTCLAP